MRIWFAEIQLIAERLPRSLLFMDKYCDVSLENIAIKMMFQIFTSWLTHTTAMLTDSSSLNILRPVCNQLYATIYTICNSSLCAGSANKWLSSAVSRQCEPLQEVMFSSKLRWKNLKISLALSMDKLGTFRWRSAGELRRNKASIRRESNMSTKNLLKVDPLIVAEIIACYVFVVCAALSDFTM